MKRLADKVVIIYGRGTVGVSVAEAFAREGAKVVLTGHDAVDALNEAAVRQHLDGVVKKEGRVDVSFNAIGLPQKGIQGTALTELPVDRYSLPIETYTRSHFITATAAARQMAGQGSGVILAHTPNASRISPPFVGGMIPAWAALEAFYRSLSVECAVSGVRTVCLFTTGIPETTLIDEVWEIHGKAHGISFEQFHGVMEGMTHRKRLTTLKELTDAAVFAASDEGSAMSGTILNLTAGMVVY